MPPFFLPRPAWWQWPTILSLDAPAILLVWQAIVAESAGASLAWPHRAVLATSVWLAYTVDRWLEARRLDPLVVRTPRHRFHQRWRRAVPVVCAVVLVLDVGVALIWLTPHDLAAGVVLTAAVLAYLISHQWLHRHARWRVPKEVCIAVLLSAGVWLFVRDASGGPLWWPLTLFGLLCLSNCALISRWEMEVDRLQGQSSLALESPRIASWIGWLPWLTAATAAGALGAGPTGVSVAAGAALTSAVLLVGIDQIERRIGWARARVVSDLALMTPVVVLLMR